MIEVDDATDFDSVTKFLVAVELPHMVAYIRPAHKLLSSSFPFFRERTPEPSIVPISNEQMLMQNVEKAKFSVPG